MNCCPYCNAELSGDPRDYGEYHNYIYSHDLHYWDEYRCNCPECGKEFRWFENYVFTEQKWLFNGDSIEESE